MTSESACSLLSHEDKCIAASFNILIYKKWKSKTKTSHRPGTTALDGTDWFLTWLQQGRKDCWSNCSHWGLVQFLELK